MYPQQQQVNSDNFCLQVILTPVGPYYKTGFNPIRLTADMPYVRAWPGGTGFGKNRFFRLLRFCDMIQSILSLQFFIMFQAKCGGNYASTMKPQAEAAAKGYGQVLWLFGENEEITEVGAMNIFFLLINKNTGRQELVTAPLTRGDILAGVTRDSILYLAREKWAAEMEVSERFLTMKEIKEAYEEGRLIEAFGAGTAAVVTPVGCIQYRGIDMEFTNAPGKITKRIWDEITGVQYGKVVGPSGWSVNIETTIPK